MPALVQNTFLGDEHYGKFGLPQTKRTLLRDLSGTSTFSAGHIGRHARTLGRVRVKFLLAVTTGNAWE
eukprot:11227725-Lingulodinium_polyedra.AAC.1